MKYYHMILRDANLIKTIHLYNLKNNNCVYCNHLNLLLLLAAIKILIWITLI